MRLAAWYLLIVEGSVMAKSSYTSVIARAFGIIRILWNKTDTEHGLTRSELDEACRSEGIDADSRMLFAALDGAQEAGVPVVRPDKPGPADAGYRFMERPFDSWEVSFLSDAVLCSRALSRSEKAGIRERLARLVPECDRTFLGRNILMGRSCDLYQTVLARNLSVLQDAISARKRITFTYLQTDADGKPVTRSSSSGVAIEPYTLLYRDECYYLLAGKACDDGIVKRTYRVDRMKDVCLTDALCRESMESLDINPRLILSGAFDMFIEGDPVDVRLACTEDVSKYIVERFGKDVVVAVDDDFCHAVVRVWVSPGFFSWVFLFDGKMKIEEPDEVVSEYQAMLKRACGK